MMTHTSSKNFNGHTTWFLVQPDPTDEQGFDDDSDTIPF